MSRIGSNRRRTIEVSATMLRDILIGNDSAGFSHVIMSASNEDLSLVPGTTVSKYSRNDTVVTPLFVQYPPQKVDSISTPESSGSDDVPAVAAPVSTSSPKMTRRRRTKRAPYYVGDTAPDCSTDSDISNPPPPCCSCYPEEYDESMYRILPGSREMELLEQGRGLSAEKDHFVDPSKASFPYCCLTSQYGGHCNGVEVCACADVSAQSAELPAHAQCCLLQNGVVSCSERFSEFSINQTGCCCCNCEQVPNRDGFVSQEFGVQADEPPAVTPMKKTWFLKDVVRSVIGGGRDPDDQSGRKASTERKNLQKSLAELKLDLPRVQSAGTTVSEASSSSKSSVHRSRSNENATNLPRIAPSKRTLSQFQAQPFHRSYSRHEHPSSFRSRQLLRATISHKIDNRRETVYTAWDNHHPAQPKTSSKRRPLLLEDKEGPRSLPVEVPRAPIPTPPVSRHPESYSRYPDSSLEESFGVDTTLGSGSHYQTPNDRNGDYSYAYDSSLSPAFIIKYDDKESDYCDDKKVENIYEEIAESSGSERRSNSAGSSQKSLNSDSGISMVKPKYSQGTLDVHPAKKKDEKLSALDNLLFRTAPGMTASERLDLRKSLVDEVFEELIKRHHDRVLNQLKLDVEDFIAPSTEGSASLKKCESMDLKDIAPKKSSKKSLEKRNSEGGLKSSLMSHARRYSEAFNRKYFGRKSEEKMSSILSPTSSFDLLDNKADFPSGNYKKKPDEDDDEATDRRLRRSQIIQSFLEQSDELNEEDEDEPSSISTRI